MREGTRRPRLLRTMATNTAVLAVVLATVLALPATALARDYADVHEGDWYYDAVQWAADRGVMTGYDDGSNRFGPNDDLLREQEATVLYRYLGDGAESPVAAFSDVVAGQYYVPAVNWANASGTMTGYAGTTLFGVGNPLTREELATVMTRVCGADTSDVDAAKFDALPDHDDTSAWALDNVRWAVANGVINGFDNHDGTRTLAPQAPVSRAQMAQVMKNAVEGGLLKKSGNSTKTGDDNGAQTKTCKVRFVSEEGGTERVISEAKYKKGDQVRVPANPTRQDYEFRSWNTDDSGSGTALPTSPTCTGDTTWKAVWAPVAPADYTEDGMGFSGVRYADGVKVVMGNISADLRSVTVADKQTGVEVGDLVVTDKDDPTSGVALRVSSVEVENGQTVIRGTAPDATEVFQELVMFGDTTVSDEDVQGIEVQALISDEDHGTKKLPPHFNGTIAKGGVSGKDERWDDELLGSFGDRHAWSINGSLDYDVALKGTLAYRYEIHLFRETKAVVKLDMDTTKTLTGSVDGVGKYHLGMLVKGPVRLDVDLAVGASGKADVTASEAHDTMGFTLDTDGLRFDGLNHKEEVGDSYSWGIEGKVGISADTSLVAKSNMRVVHAETNIGAHVSYEKFQRSSSFTCEDRLANMYLDFAFGSDCEVMQKLMDLVGVPGTKVVWDDSESPLIRSQHIENGKTIADEKDGKANEKCTWGQNNSKDGGDKTDTKEPDELVDPGVEVRDEVSEYSWGELSEIADAIAQSSESNALQIERKYHLVNNDGELDGTQTKRVSMNSQGKSGIGYSEYTAQIVGFRHDERSDGTGKAGISWLFMNPPLWMTMLTTDDNYYGWDTSRLRSMMNDDIYYSLPDDLRDAIKPVNKSANDTGGDVAQLESTALVVGTSEDRLWAPSLREVYGAIRLMGGVYDEVLNMEGDQYQLYRDCGVDATAENNDILNKDGAYAWWLRTASPAKQDYCYCVDSMGKPNEQYIGNGCSVIPGFCI